MRRVKATIPMAECQRRALSILHRFDPQPASSVARAIWPDAEWRAMQGAGAAASRVLKTLEKEGLARWVVSGEGRAQTWGWVKRERAASVLSRDPVTEGREAFDTGLSETANPYPCDSEAHLSWNAGFNQAAEEAEIA